MNRFLQNGKLVSDLDFDGHNVLNMGSSTPPNVPPGIVGTDNPELIDGRDVPDGSVTNEKINVLAGIVQSKLDLDGTIPTSWLGDDSNQVAKGNLAERVSHRGANNGYVALDSNGVLGVSKLASTGPGVGTVLIVDFSLPRDFDLDVDEVSTAGALTASWKDIPDNSWFGAWGTKYAGWPVGQPFFVTDPIPDALVPSLAGSKFTTGVFDLERLPVGISVGVNHAKGLVPDPDKLSMASDPSDYLARDLSWKRMITDASYQPMLPDIQITLLSYFGDKARISIQCPKHGSSLFYQFSGFTNYGQAASNPFTGLFTVGVTIKAYASKAGYNDSHVASFQVPPQPSG